MKRWAIWGAILAAGLGLGAARPALGQTAQPQVIVVSLTGTVDPLSARYVEHREIRRWMRTNPPSVGRDSGARC